MGRWEPNAQSRLRQAAMELYSERGYDQTTVAEIAERAGLTERTFFRHFADKREVLFAGSDRMQEMLVESVAASPLPPGMAAVVAAFELLAADFFAPLTYSRQRQRVIDANPALQERELAKLDRVAAALAVTLRLRGLGDPAAALTAEAGVAAFKVAFARWVTDPDDGALADHLRESFTALRAVLAPAPSGALAPASSGTLAPAASGSLNPAPSGSLNPAPSGSLNPAPSGSLNPAPSGSLASAPIESRAPSSI